MNRSEADAPLDPFKLFKTIGETGSPAPDHEPAQLFENEVEYSIAETIFMYLKRKKANVLIYEVENFENLTDYANLFLKLQAARLVMIRDMNICVNTVTSTQYGVYGLDAVEQAKAMKCTPVIAHFLGDLLTGSTESPDYKELVNLLLTALFEKDVYVILFTTNPAILYDNIPVARYGIHVRDVAPIIVAQKHPDKARYARMVGFKKLAEMTPQEIEEYLRKRTLPTPHTLERVEKDVTFKDLVLPPSLKEFIRINVINPLKRGSELIPSILLLGPHGAGKTTLGYAIAQALGLQALLVRVELIGSRWLGETEKLANQTLLMANEMSPAVLIFRDAELILGGRGRGGGEESMVYERVRAIITTWLRSKKRRFFAVFTVSNPKHLPEYVLHDATFGVFKLPILPPMRAEERKALLVMFLRKVTAPYGIEFDPLDPLVEDALRVVAEDTWGYTPRELQEIAKTTVNLALDRGLKKINKEIIQLARRYVEIDRVSRFTMIKNIINACKKVGMPEQLLIDIYKMEDEVAKLKAEALDREVRKRSEVKIFK